MSDAPHTSYMQALEGLSEQKPAAVPLFLPRQTNPVGYLSFSPEAELAGLRLCVAGELYDGVITGPGSPIYFTEAQQ